MKERGQLAYEAYYDARGGVLLNGKEMETWDRLVYPIRYAWGQAEIAVRAAMKNELEAVKDRKP